MTSEKGLKWRTSRAWAGCSASTFYQTHTLPSLTSLSLQSRQRPSCLVKSSFATILGAISTENQPPSPVDNEHQTYSPHLMKYIARCFHCRHIKDISLSSQLKAQWHNLLTLGFQWLIGTTSNTTLQFFSPFTDKSFVKKGVMNLGGTPSTFYWHFPDKFSSKRAKYCVFCSKNTRFWSQK